VRLARAGANVIPFTGRLAGHTLAPGNYRALLAVRAGNGLTSNVATAPFTILPATRPTHTRHARHRASTAATARSVNTPSG
jgi:hypothetical protein